VLQEWRANVDLYIHHDNLKQDRIRHFLTMQGALLAFVGLATKQAIEGRNSLLMFVVFLLFSIGISCVGYLLGSAWKRMDQRARQFTLFERKRLRDLEKEWSLLLREDKAGLGTYTSLAAVLEKGGNKFPNIGVERRDEIREDYCRDYHELGVETKAAS